MPATFSTLNKNGQILREIFRLAHALSLAHTFCSLIFNVQNVANIAFGVAAPIERPLCVNQYAYIQSNRRLVRAHCASQSEEQQAAFLRNYLQYVQNSGEPLGLPLISNDSITLFYGENATAPLDSDDEAAAAAVASEEASNWPQLERAIVELAHSPSLVFTPLQTYADANSDNRKAPATIANERCFVRLLLTNPLKISLYLRKIQLVLSDVSIF